MSTLPLDEPTSASDGNIPYIGATADDGTGNTLRDAIIRINARLKELYGAQNASNVVQTPFIDGDNIKNDTVDSQHYAAGSIDNEHLADNAVDHDELADRYTAVQSITTTSGTINLDTSSYSNFRLTSDLTGATTLNIQNMKTGQVIDITVSGSQTITFSSDDTSETFNKVGGVDYDGASDNHIQVVCIDDTDSAAIYNYAIGTYTSDTTP